MKWANEKAIQKVAFSKKPFRSVAYYGKEKKWKVIIQVFVLVKTLMLLHQKLWSHPQLQRLELLQRKTQKILPLIPILNIH